MKNKTGGARRISRVAVQRPSLPEKRTDCVRDDSQNTTPRTTPQKRKSVEKESQLQFYTDWKTDKGREMQDRF